MKLLLLTGSVLLFLALADMPSGYYTLLRIAITIIAIVGIINEQKEGINFWVIIFGLIAILFNPIIPIYFYDKAMWMPIDIGVAILFGVKAFMKPIKVNLE